MIMALVMIAVQITPGSANQGLFVKLSDPSPGAGEVSRRPLLISQAHKQEFLLTIFVGLFRRTKSLTRSLKSMESCEDNTMEL